MCKHRRAIPCMSHGFIILRYGQPPLPKPHSLISDINSRIYISVVIIRTADNPTLWPQVFLSLRSVTTNWTIWLLAKNLSTTSFYPVPRLYFKNPGTFPTHYLKQIFKVQHLWHCFHLGFYTYTIISILLAALTAYAENPFVTGTFSWSFATWFSACYGCSNLLHLEVCAAPHTIFPLHSCNTSDMQVHSVAVMI